MSGFARNLLKTLLSALAAILAVAALLFAAYRLIIAPAGNGSQAETAIQQRDQPQSLRSLALRLMLATKRDALKPASDNPDAPSVPFSIEPGETVSDVALRLQNSGLIRDAGTFELLLQYHGLDRHVEAGNFQLSPAMTAEEIAQALQNAGGNDVVLVSLEGWRLEQVAEAVDLAFGNGPEFLGLAMGQAQALAPAWVGLPAEVNSLEGMLFPDTYRFHPEASASDILNTMLQTFEARFSPENRARAQEIGLTPYQVLVVASIVEREAVVPEERPLIAAVFLNRLQLGMKLEADPTVQYALGYQTDTGRWWKVPLLLADLEETTSLYNTYQHDGLPPTPICSPGLDSIEAVLSPADVDYLYFVAKDDSSHVFTDSFEEHLSNVAKFQGG